MYYDTRRNNDESAVVEGSQIVNSIQKRNKLIEYRREISQQDTKEKQNRRVGKAQMKSNMKQWKRKKNHMSIRAQMVYMLHLPHYQQISTHSNKIVTIKREH